MPPSAKTQRLKIFPLYQVYKGTVFEITDQALNFVLSKIDLAVGTREKSAQAPVEYELPPDVVREAIVKFMIYGNYCLLLVIAGAMRRLIFCWIFLLSMETD